MINAVYTVLVLYTNRYELCCMTRCIIKFPTRDSFGCYVSQQTHVIESYKLSQHFKYQKHINFAPRSNKPSTPHIHIASSEQISTNVVAEAAHSAHLISPQYLEFYYLA